MPSEEAAFKRETEAFKAALKEIEEEKKPKLRLGFEEEQPPFHIEAGEQKTIELKLNLVQGDVARKPRVYFVAPPGFDFSGRKTWLQSKDREGTPGYITASVDFPDCRRGITEPSNILIKAPLNVGKFTLYHRTTCEGFDGGEQEFEVVVTSPQQKPPK